MRVDAAVLIGVAVVGGALWYVTRKRDEPAPAPTTGAGNGLFAVLPQLFDSTTRLFNSIGSLGKGDNYEKADTSASQVYAAEAGGAVIGYVPPQYRTTPY